MSRTFPLNGIRLSFLQTFIDIYCGGREKLQGLTTTFVIDKFIKPQTLLWQQSFCDMLESQGYEDHGFCIAKAQVFISHAWQYIFLDVVDALQFHFIDTPDIVIWFDLFSINQHKENDLDFHGLCNMFTSTIKDFGMLFLCLFHFRLYLLGMTRFP